ncbi:MAG TPA: arsenic resistance N-acetyltransferase ArsN2 [Gemmatimonas sp.]|nr:arsenic resistance N-acetyltransferase ArsN2 [Gemmatimonas sp.]
MTIITPSTAPVLRAASVEDTEAIQALLVATGLPTDGVAELLASDASQFVVGVAPGAGAELVAVAGLEMCCDSALLRSVAVREDWQRHGLGHQLVKRVVCEAESRGINALYLLTMTAEHYFPRFGFETIAREAVPAEIANTLEFKSACPASATAMMRTLLPA